jgi:DeoR/GlpR family transcriptional regulator of sugar metabolism
MLARHRQSLILQAVRSDGSARVSDLTQRLGVSDMTIRRDLEVLARDGLVEKVHGGAVLPGTPASPEPGFEAKLVLERPEKNAIARAAARLVRPGTAIAVAAGSTTLALAQCLLDVPGLTIVTNSLRVMNAFSGTRGLDGTADSLILTGGVRTASDALVGPMADLTIRSLHFDLLFLGCFGFDAEAGLTTPNLAEAETNRTFIRVARRVVLLADHTKWGVVSLSSFARLNEVDVLVTDDLLPADARAEAAEAVGEVVYAQAVTTSHALRQTGLRDREASVGRDSVGRDNGMAGGSGLRVIVPGRGGLLR